MDRRRHGPPSGDVLDVSRGRGELRGPTRAEPGCVRQSCQHGLLIGHHARALDFLPVGLAPSFVTTRLLCASARSHTDSTVATTSCTCATLRGADAVTSPAPQMCDLS